MSASCRRLGAKQARLAIDGSVPEDLLDRLRQCMRHEVIGDELTAFAAMPCTLAVEGPAERGRGPDGRQGRLTERPLEVRVALLGVPAAPAAGAGLRPPGTRRR
jgi:hypothetical protein